MRNQLICADCEKLGQRSTVRPLGVSKTNDAIDNFWDETGQAHSHDPNVTQERFKCSNGHLFHIDRKHECHCGWEV